MTTAMVWKTTEISSRNKATELAKLLFADSGVGFHRARCAYRRHAATATCSRKINGSWQRPRHRRTIQPGGVCVFHIHQTDGWSRSTKPEGSLMQMQACKHASRNTRGVSYGQSNSPIFFVPPFSSLASRRNCSPVARWIPQGNATAVLWVPQRLN